MYTVSSNSIISMLAVIVIHTLIPVIAVILCTHILYVTVAVIVIPLFYLKFTYNISEGSRIIFIIP